MALIGMAVTDLSNAFYRFTLLPFYFSKLGAVCRNQKAGLSLGHGSHRHGGGSPQQRFLPFYSFAFLLFQAGSRL